MRAALVIRFVAWLALTGPALAQGPANLMPGGGFEDGMGGWEASVTDPGGLGAAVAVDPAHARQGKSCLRISLPGPGNAAITSPAAPVRAGEDHLLTFWYRSEGFSETGNYAGVNLQYVLHWLDADKKPVGRDGQGLSYGAVAEWRFMVRMVTPPPGAAFVKLSFPMSVSEKGRPSRFWLDDVGWRVWPGKPKAGGKTWVFHVAEGTYQKSLFRRVADDDTATGFAVLANPRFQRASGYLAANLYTRAIPAGQYRAVFRLKIAAIPAQPQTLLRWDVNTDSVGFLGAGRIGSAAFKRAGVYQDFAVRFVVPPGVQWIDPRLTWHGGAATWIDTITIVEEKVFTPEDIKALME